MQLLWHIEIHLTQSKQNRGTWRPSFCLHHVGSGDWYAFNRVWPPFRFLFVRRLAGQKTAELTGSYWSSSHDLGLYNTKVLSIELTHPYAHLYTWQGKQHHAMRCLCFCATTNNRPFLPTVKNLPIWFFTLLANNKS